MIITRIYGGLGNQLFQYAASRALAEKHRTEVKLDLSLFENYDLRNFELAKLNLPFSLAQPDEMARLKAFNSFQRIKARLTPYRFRHFYKEPFFHFDPAFFRLPETVYLRGYFQSENYFLPIREIIKQEYDFTHLVSTALHETAKVFQQQPSVAMHIRRGDYKNPETQKMHGILPLDYYKSAIALIKTKLPEARFYLFSDDPGKAMRELNEPNMTVISGNLTHNHFEDIYLMSHCRHNIIANSSFSWWAAWLNRNQEKMVIAPKAWFNKGPKDTQDLLPQSWTRL